MNMPKRHFMKSRCCAVSATVAAAAAPASAAGAGGVSAAAMRAAGQIAILMRGGRVIGGAWVGIRAHLAPARESRPLMIPNRPDSAKLFPAPHAKGGASQGVTRAAPLLRWVVVRGLVRRLDEVLIVLCDGRFSLLHNIAVEALGMVHDERIGSGGCF